MYIASINNTICYPTEYHQVLSAKHPPLYFRYLYPPLDKQRVPTIHNIPKSVSMRITIYLL